MVTRQLKKFDFCAFLVSFFREHVKRFHALALGSQFNVTGATGGIARHTATSKGNID